MSVVIYTAMKYWRKTTQLDRRIRDNFQIREMPIGLHCERFLATEKSLTFFTVYRADDKWTHGKPAVENDVTIIMKSLIAVFIYCF